ncbi:MAG: hypothetical protein K0S11_1506 [Gammaproteobacteria bacterium]|jgi:hypothetical protein|nr:hypothetical protein [Gammaproteobacteria bacterium]
MLAQTTNTNNLFIELAQFDDDNFLTSLQDTALEQYLEAYLINKETLSFAKSELVSKMALKSILLGFGAAWGVPWTSASANAAVIFPKGLTRKIFEYIFAGGIVVSVGADGLWIMEEVSKSFATKAKEEKALLSGQHQSCGAYVKKGTALLVPLFLSGITCVSPVYAILKYSHGVKRLFSIITLVGNLGYGTYGYSKLLGQLYNAIKSYGKTKDEGEAIKNLLLANINAELADPKGMIANNFQGISSGYGLIKALLNRDTPAPMGRVAKTARGLFVYIPTVLVPGLSTLVTYFLAKEALQSIYNHPAFYYSVAAVSDVPALTVSLVSCHGIFGYIFDLFYKQNKPLVQDQYPILNMMKILLIGLISLTAPTAGAYVTYNTLSEENLPLPLVWIATASIILARIMFAAFTMDKLADQAITFCAQRLNNEVVDNHSRLQRARDTISQLPTSCFSPYKNLVNKTHERRLLLTHTSHNLFSQKTINSVSVRPTTPRPI